jgi:hypothetical protein
METHEIHLPPAVVSIKITVESQAWTNNAPDKLNEAFVGYESDDSDDSDYFDGHYGCSTPIEDSNLHTIHSTPDRAPVRICPGAPSRPSFAAISDALHDKCRLSESRTANHSGSPHEILEEDDDK